MFKKILVPLDGSEISERALEPAVTIAQKTMGQIVLLSAPVLKPVLVAEPAGYGALLSEDSFERSRQELAAYLGSIQERWAKSGLGMRRVVVEGDAASVIVDSAAAERVDLIVMSTHGRSGFTRWMLGSVTERVLRSAPCPVLVIRSGDPLRRILITLDGSELAEQALGPGYEIAKSLDGEITLLYVVKKFDQGEAKYLEGLEAGLSQRLREEANAYLQAVAGSHQWDRKEPSTIVEEGPAEARILDVAETLGIDLIVMATHGRTGLRRWVYGSVTEKILHSALCAMLVVRPNWQIGFQGQRD